MRNVFAIMRGYSHIIMLWVVFIFGFFFVYYEAYHTTQLDYIRETVLTLMAASVTITITSLLLRQQTDSEELKNNHAEVFKKKFEVYTDFVNMIIESFEDGENQPENVKNIEKSLYKVLLFIENPKTFDILYKVVVDSVKNNNRKKIGLLLYALRNELGIHGQAKELEKEEFWGKLGGKIDHFLDMVDQEQ